MFVQTHSGSLRCVGGIELHCLALASVLKSSSGLTCVAKLIAGEATIGAGSGAVSLSPSSGSVGSSFGWTIESFGLSIGTAGTACRAGATIFLGA